MKKPARFVRFLIALQVLVLASQVFPQGKTQKWMEVQSPHFLVVTNGSEQKGRKLAYQFEAIRSVFEQTLGLRVDSGKPFVVMAFKNENSMHAVLPEFYEKPYFIVYHEYTHMVLQLNDPSMPLWMEEGLAEFYSFSTIGKNEVEVGRPDAYHLQTLRNGQLLPLAELFRVTYDSPHYTETAKAPMFYAESWALTHYLILAEKTEAGRPNRLSQFWPLLRQGIDQDEAVRRAFGDLGRLQADLEEYLRPGTFPYLGIITKTAGTPKDFRVRVLSPAETAARLDDFKRQGAR